MMFKPMMVADVALALAACSGSSDTGIPDIEEDVSIYQGFMGRRLFITTLRARITRLMTTWVFARFTLLSTTRVITTPRF